MTLTSDVVSAAQASDRRWGVFASVSIGQFALESGWGRLATGAFNFFGIKADPDQPGVVCHTHEEVDGRLVPRLCRFRSFASVDQAFDEHARLISTDHRYAGAMAAKADLVRFVHALAPVYATDKTYGDKLLELIRSEGLERYDVAAAPAS